MITQAIGSAAAPLTLLHGSALQPKGVAVPPTSGSAGALAHVGWSMTSQHSIFGNSSDLTSFPISSLGRQRGNQACQIACSTLVEASPPVEQKLPNPETILPVQLALEEKEEVEATAIGNYDERSTSGIAAPSPFEIQSLLMQLCDETSIAELSLKVGDFQLRVLRDVNNLGKPKKPVYHAPISAPHVPGGPMIEAMGSPASANGKALSLSARPAQSSFEVDTEDDDEVDEGLLCVLSPKVGVFRRGRFYKGKRGRPMIVEGVMIKTGQVIGYLEQLGTQQPIESEHAGEVVRFPVEDGEPVGYGERLVEIRPSFPGIK